MVATDPSKVATIDASVWDSADVSRHGLGDTLLGLDAGV